MVIIDLTSHRFIHPIVYGEYPRTMQDIVGDRLPKFTKEEVKMVKGSMDFVGINQYTAFYMYDPHQPKSKDLGYQQEWNVGFACKLFPSSSKFSICKLFCHSSLFFLTVFSNDLCDYHERCR